MAHSKIELLSKIKEIVNNSNYLPKWIIEKSNEYEQDKLEKLLIFVFKLSEQEKSMSFDDKNKLDELLTKFYQEKTKIYQEGAKEVLNIAQNKQDEQDEIDAENLLHNL